MVKAIVEDPDTGELVVVEESRPGAIREGEESATEAIEEAKKKEEEETGEGEEEPEPVTETQTRPQPSAERLKQIERGEIERERREVQAAALRGEEEAIARVSGGQVLERFVEKREAEREEDIRQQLLDIEDRIGRELTNTEREQLRAGESVSIERKTVSVPGVTGVGPVAPEEPEPFSLGVAEDRVVSERFFPEFELTQLKVREEVDVIRERGDTKVTPEELRAPEFIREAFPGTKQFSVSDVEAIKLFGFATAGATFTGAGTVAARRIALKGPSLLPTFQASQTVTGGGLTFLFAKQARERVQAGEDPLVVGREGLAFVLGGKAGVSIGKRVPIESPFDVPSIQTPETFKSFIASERGGKQFLIEKPKRIIKTPKGKFNLDRDIVFFPGIGTGGGLGGLKTPRGIFGKSRVATSKLGRADPEAIARAQQRATQQLLKKFEEGKISEEVAIRLGLIEPPVELVTGKPFIFTPTTLKQTFFTETKQEQVLDVEQQQVPIEITGLETPQTQQLRQPILFDLDTPQKPDVREELRLSAATLPGEDIKPTKKELSEQRTVFSIIEKPPSPEKPDPTITEDIFRPSDEPPPEIKVPDKPPPPPPKTPPPDTFEDTPKDPIGGGFLGLGRGGKEEEVPVGFQVFFKGRKGEKVISKEEPFFTAKGAEKFAALVSARTAFKGFEIKKVKAPRRQRLRRTEFKEAKEFGDFFKKVGPGEFEEVPKGKKKKTGLSSFLGETGKKGKRGKGKGLGGFL